MPDLKELHDLLRKGRKAAAPAVAALSKYARERQAESPNPFALAELLRKMEDAVAGLAKASQDVMTAFLPFIESEKASVEERRKDYQFEFIRKLEEGFAAMGAAMRGQLPSLRAGFYRLEVDFLAKKVSVAFGPETLKALPLSASEVVNFVSGFDTDLRKRLFPADKFFDILHSAYRRTCRIAGRDEGEKVPLPEVLREAAFSIQGDKFLADPDRHNFTPLSRLQFAVQLAELRRAGLLARGGEELVLVEAPFDATFKRHQFVWVPEEGEGGGTRYAYVLFRKAAGQAS